MEYETVLTLTTNIWVLQVNPIPLGVQKHLQVDSSGLRLVIDEAGWNASRQVRLIAAEPQFQENLLRVIFPKVKYVHHTGDRTTF